MVRPARVRTAAALTDLATGATARAEVGFTAAEALFAGTGQCLEIVYARHNRALVAFARGDLPGALRHLDDAAARYAELGVTVPDATLDRCAVLLAAAKRAELLLAAARTALAAGHYKLSAERAELSRQMFRVQHRERWRAHAALVVLQGRFWPAGTAVAMPFDVSALLDAQGAREVDFARFGLSRIARGRLAEPAGQALAVAGRPGRGPGRSRDPGRGVRTGHRAGGRDATTARVPAAIDGARLAHIAAHGVFRADSPMFCPAVSPAGSPRPAGRSSRRARDDPFPGAQDPWRRVFGPARSQQHLTRGHLGRLTGEVRRHH
jgi:hypothetical protein